MAVQCPCKICQRAVAEGQNAIIQCDSCTLCVQIKCNKVNLQTCYYLQKLVMLGIALNVSKTLFLSRK